MQPAASSDRRPFSLLVVSDIHYAGDEECRRKDHESKAIRNPLLRMAVRLYRRYIWLRDPYGHNHLLDDLLARVGEPDLVVANGDYTLDTAFVGVSDPAALSSARGCLERLRRRFGDRLKAVMGDHELGKMSMFGGCGGMRYASLEHAMGELGLVPFWRWERGPHVLLGITSSLVALPVFQPETLPEEWAAWQRAREEHLEEIRQAFRTLRASQRVLLFCHDPTALSILAREPVVRDRLPQIEHTIIGHLHSPLILAQSRLLSGVPCIRFLGNTARRLTQALHEARAWRPFRVTLCPALAGIELLKDGGYLVGTLPADPHEPSQFHRVRLPRG